MDGFGWSTQRHPAAASCPGDDALLAAFLGGASATSLELLHSATAGDISDAAYGHELPPSCQDDDLRRLLRCRDSVSPLPFAVDDPPKSAFLHNSAGSLLRAPAPPPIAAHDSFVAFFSNAGDAFSGTAAGNISSGESNTCCRPGGRDAEVASPPIPPETRTTTGTEATEQETIYRAAAMRPVVVVDPRQTSSSSPAPAAEPHHPPRRRRRNVRISSEPQTVAARLRREKVSERLRALRRLVPGGGSGKMDTASMLHQAACYLRFLKAQLARFQAMAADGDGRYSSSSSSSSSMQRYVGRPPPWNSNPECLGDGRDGVAAGYVRPSNRNMQSL